MKTDTIVKTLLLVSLATNLLIAGAVVGHWQAGGFGPPPPLAWSVGDLSDAMRTDMHHRFRDHGDEVGGIRSELRDAAQQIRRTALSEPYDPEDVRAALTQFRETSFRYQKLVHHLAADGLARLPPELRRKALKRLLEPGPRRRPPQ